MKARHVTPPRFARETSSQKTKWLPELTTPKPDCHRCPGFDRSRGPRGSTSLKAFISPRKTIVIEARNAEVKVSHLSVYANGKS